MSKGRVTYVHTIRDGDTILVDGRPTEVLGIRRAQGRKPAQGENLHLLTGGGYVSVNSHAPIRVLSRASST